MTRVAVRSGRRATTRRLVRAGALVVAALVVAGLAVLAAALVAGEAPGEGTWAIAPVLGAAFVAAVAWPWAGRGAVALLDRVGRGPQRAPREVVRAFEAGSGRDVPDDELLVQLAEGLVRAFDAGAAEVWLADGAGALVCRAAVPARSPGPVELGEAAERVLAGSGVVGRSWLALWLPELADDGTGEVRVVPATHAGDLRGLVVVRRAEGAERFAAEDDAVLAELGRRVGVVLHNRHLDAALQLSLADLRRTNEELRASRVRLVATADAERRRIERDLHDGAQQHLVALAVNLRLAGDAIAEDPAIADEVLGGLGEELRAAIGELRSLAHGIYPPLLADAGLAEALRVAAGRAPGPVVLEAGQVGRYPTEVEAAVYFCCTEALQNAAKHAPGAPVRISLEGDAGGVRFVVEDEGPGIGDATMASGHGLQNMADRVGALGGTLTVGTSGTGGARVAGEVPVAGPSGRP